MFMMFPATMEYDPETGLQVKKTIKTKFTNPYDFDPIVYYKVDPKSPKTFGSAYSDRMAGWDYNKYNTSKREIFGSESDYFESYDHKQIEKFLCLYFGRKLRLLEVIEYCNANNGFSYWYFSFEDKK